MNERHNRIILGAVIVVIALYVLLAGGSFRLTPLVFAAIGMVFLLIFWTKRSTMSLIAGVYLLVIGIGQFVQPYLTPELQRAVMPSALFLSPGFIFLLLYRFKNKLGLLVPSFMFIGFGIYIICRKTAFIGGSINSPGLLAISLGLALIAAFIIGRAHTGKGTLRTGLLLLITGALIGTGMSNMLVKIMLALVLFTGAGFILSAIKKK